MGKKESKRVLVKTSNFKFAKNVFNAKWSPDFTMIAVAASEGMIYIFDTVNHRILLEIPCHESDILDVAWSPDGKLLYSVSYDESISLWDALSGKFIDEKENAHLREIYTVAVSPDGNMIATGSGDKIISIWDSKLKKISELKGHKSEINKVIWSKDNLLISCEDGKNVFVWEFGKKKPKLIYKRHKDFVKDIYRLNESKIYTASYDGTIHLWSLEKGELETKIDIGDSIERISYNPNNNTIAVGTVRGDVYIVDNSGKIIIELPSHDCGIVALAWDNKGQRLFSISSDGELRIHQISQLAYKTGKIEIGESEYESLILKSVKPIEPIEKLPSKKKLEELPVDQLIASASEHASRAEEAFKAHDYETAKRLWETSKTYLELVMKMEKKKSPLWTKAKDRIEILNMNLRLLEFAKFYEPAMMNYESAMNLLSSDDLTLIDYETILSSLKTAKEQFKKAESVAKKQKMKDRVAECKEKVREISDKESELKEIIKKLEKTEQITEIKRELSIVLDKCKSDFKHRSFEALPESLEKARGLLYSLRDVDKDSQEFVEKELESLNDMEKQMEYILDQQRIEDEVKSLSDLETSMKRYFKESNFDKTIGAAENLKNLSESLKIECSSFGLERLISILDKYISESESILEKVREMQELSEFQERVNETIRKYNSSFEIKDFHKRINSIKNVLKEIESLIDEGSSKGYDTSELKEVLKTGSKKVEELESKIDKSLDKIKPIDI